MFERQFPDGICGPVALLRSLDPVGTHLNNDLFARCTERYGGHTTAKFGLGFKDDEIIDALLVQRSSSDDACHASAEDEDGGVLGRGGGRRVDILGERS